MFADVLVSLVFTVSLVETVNGDIVDASMLVVTVAAVAVVAIVVVPDEIDGVSYVVEISRLGLN